MTLSIFPIYRVKDSRNLHSLLCSGRQLKEPAFNDPRLVANAGLMLPATLALRLGLGELVEQHLDLGRAPGRANTGDKLMTLVASALAGGDRIDDADALRAGGAASVIGCVVKAPSTLGTFLRSFRWGHVRQLDRVSRELLARAWKAATRPRDSPLTIDLDSTICETYGLSRLQNSTAGWIASSGARATTASFAWLHSRRSSVPTLTAAPTPSVTTAMTPLPAVRGLKRVGTIWMNSTNKKGSPKSCAMLGNGLSGPRNWAWPRCYCCWPWPAPLRLPRLRQRLGYLPVLQLQMALPRPPGRRLLQRLPVHPKPRLKEPGKSKPRSTTLRTLPNPYREGAEPVETARRRPYREAAEPTATTRLLPYRIRAS